MSQLRLSAIPPLPVGFDPKTTELQVVRAGGLIDDGLADHVLLVSFGRSIP